MNKQQLANKMKKTIGKAVCKCGRAAEKKADEKILIQYCSSAVTYCVRRAIRVRSSKSAI